MNTQHTENLRQAVEIIENEFSFIKDLKIYYYKNIIGGGFWYRKMDNGFGEIIDSPIVPISFKYSDTTHVGGSSTMHYEVEDIVNYLREIIKNGLLFMKYADEEIAREDEEEVEYRYDYDTILN